MRQNHSILYTVNPWHNKTDKLDPVVEPNCAMRY